MRTLIYVLAAAQLLLCAPVVTAASAMAATAEMPCAEMMHAMQANPDDCPCCPEDGGSIASCLLNCTAGPAVFITFQLSVTPQRARATPIAGFIAHAGNTDPPLKPPPIL